MAVQPGRDYNYPTSSGNAAAGFMGSSVSINGFHVSVMLIAVILSLIVVYHMGKRRRK